MPAPEQPKAKGGQTTFLTRWGLTAPLELHKPIKTFFKMIYLIREYRARIKRAYSPTEALKATLQANWPKVLLAITLAVSLAGLLAK